MKKRFLISLLLSLAVIMPVMSVFADGPGPAIVIKGAYCGLMDADGNIFMSTCSHIVISNDKNGNTKLTCHATQPDYASKPLKAVLWNYDNTGLLCGTPLGATRDWMEVVTPSGKVTLVAHINPNPTPQKIATGQSEMLAKPELQLSNLPSFLCYVVTRDKAFSSVQIGVTAL